MTANTHDLAFRPSHAQQWFLTLADATDDPELARVRDISHDPQGYYVAGADGQSYGWVNDADPSDLHRFLDRALKQWRAHPPRRVTVTATERDEPWARFPDPSTEVVRIYSRIRPLPKDVWGLNRGVGRDFLWIYREELQAIAGSAITAGTEVTLPQSLVQRLVRYHLVDGVRGTPDMWGPRAVRRAEAHARLISVEGNIARIAFNLVFAMRAPGRHARGYQGRLDGELAIDRTTLRLTRFRAIAEGSAWGAGKYVPFPPPGRFHLIIAMTEARDEVARQVPPEAVSTRRSDEEYRRPH